MGGEGNDVVLSYLLSPLLLSLIVVLSMVDDVVFVGTKVRGC